MRTNKRKFNDPNQREFVAIICEPFRRKFRLAAGDGVPPSVFHVWLLTSRTKTPSTVPLFTLAKLAPLLERFTNGVTGSPISLPPHPQKRKNCRPMKPVG